MPNLKTVLEVENILKNAETTMSKGALLRKMSRKKHGIMRQTLNIILAYLEDSGKIYIGSKGILWIYNPSKKLAKAIEEGVQVR